MMKLVLGEWKSVESVGGCCWKMELIVGGEEYEFEREDGRVFIPERFSPKLTFAQPCFLIHVSSTRVQGHDRQQRSAELVINAPGGEARLVSYLFRTLPPAHDRPHGRFGHGKPPMTLSSDHITISSRVYVYYALV